jgi:hypothetical protein
MDLNKKVNNAKFVVNVSFNKIKQNEKDIEKLDKKKSLLVKQVINEKNEKNDEKILNEIEEIKNKIEILTKINLNINDTLDKVKNLADHGDINSNHIDYLKLLNGEVTNEQYRKEIDSKNNNNQLKIAALTGSAVIGSAIAYRRFRVNLLKPVKEKLDILENKFKSCKIPYEKSKSKYESNPYDYVKQTLSNLENSLSGTKFGTVSDLSDSEMLKIESENKENIIKRNNKANLALAGIVTTGVAAHAGINLYFTKRLIKNFYKRINDLNEKIKNVCKK